MKPWGAGIGRAGAARVGAHRHRRRNQNERLGIRMAIDAIFISYASIFLPEVFRRPPDHQPGDEHGTIANSNMP